MTLPEGQKNIYDNLFYRIGFTPSSFQSMCQKLFMAESSSFHILDDTIGDNGCDGYDPQSRNFYAIYFPVRPRDDTIYEKINRKIKSDIKKAAENNFRIKNWIFVIPFDPDKIIYGFIEELSKQHEFEILFYGQTKLQELLNLYAHVKEEFFGDFGSLEEAIKRIISIAEEEKPSIDLIHKLLIMAERNLSEKLENQKIYLLRKNFDLYITCLRKLCILSKDTKTLYKAFPHIQAFLINFLVQSFGNRMVFMILNEEIIQSYLEIASAKDEPFFHSIINEARAYIDVSLTLNSITGIGYLQHKNYTWWLIGALYLLSHKHQFGETNVEVLKQHNSFRCLFEQKINANDVYTANYEAIIEIAKKYRPDLFNYISELNMIIESETNNHDGDIEKKGPYHGKSSI